VLRVLLINIGTLAIFISGTTLIVKAGGGLYWSVPTLVIYVVRSALNARTLVVGTGTGSRADLRHDRRRSPFEVVP
jgi:hypothetical protein